MTEKEMIELLVEGGKAAPGPNTAPKLSAYKLNIDDVFKQVNEATAAYKGMQVPVKIIIDKETKGVEIKVGTPPVSSLIKKELGIEKAKVDTEEKGEREKAEPAIAGKKVAEKKEEPKEKEAPVKEKEEVREEMTETPKEKVEKKVVGNLKMEQVVKIAKMKMGDMLVKDLKSAVKQVVGAAGSMMGIQIEGKWPKEILKEIDEGKYDSLLK